MAVNKCKFIFLMVQGFTSCDLCAQCKHLLSAIVQLKNCGIETLLLTVWPTCAKGEEEGLVGVPLQQGGDTASHPLIALVDELLAEVAVDLLGRQPVVGRQRAVDEVRQLEARHFL